MARRRRSLIEDFLRGYQAGGVIFSGLEAAGVNDQKPEDLTEDEQGRYANALGLQREGDQARMLYEQDAAFAEGGLKPQDVAGTAQALNSVPDPTPATPGDIQKGHWFLGRGSNTAPSETQQEYLRDKEKAKIYEKYGLIDQARMYRQDARAARNDALAYQTNQLRLQQLQGEEQQKKNLKLLNKHLQKALRGDADALKALMRGGAWAYNQPFPGNDPNKVVIPPNGDPLVVTPGGTVAGTADKLLALRKNDPEAYRERVLEAALFARAGVTGDLTPVVQYMGQRQQAGLQERRLTETARHNQAVEAVDRERVDAYRKVGLARISPKAPAQPKPLSFKDWLANLPPEMANASQAGQIEAYKLYLQEWNQQFAPEAPGQKGGMAVGDAVAQQLIQQARANQAGGRKPSAKTPEKTLRSSGGQMRRGVRKERPQKPEERTREQQLKTLDRRIKQKERQLQRTSGKAKAAIRAQLQNLRKRRKELVDPTWMGV